MYGDQSAEIAPRQTWFLQGTLDLWNPMASYTAHLRQRRTSALDGDIKTLRIIRL